jgi:hypothetical protein
MAIDFVETGRVLAGRDYRRRNGATYRACGLGEHSRSGQTLVVCLSVDGPRLGSYWLVPLAEFAAGFTLVEVVEDNPVCADASAVVAEEAGAVPAEKTAGWLERVP